MILALLIPAALAALAFGSRRLGNEWLYPPAMFCGLWAFVVTYALAFGYSGFSSGDRMPGIVLVGCVSFVVGGCIAAVAATLVTDEPRRVPVARVRWIEVCIVVYAGVILLLFPAYYQQLRAVVAQLQVESFASGVRSALVTPDRGGVSRVFISVATIGSTLAYLAAALYDGSRRATLVLWCAVLPPLLFHVFTFGRSPVIQLAMGVLGILLIRRQVGMARVALFSGLAFGLFLIMGALLSKTIFQVEDISVTRGLIKSIEQYFIGGAVALDVIADNPASVGPPGLALRFVPQLAQSLGVAMTLPDNVLEYVDMRLPNIYSFFYAYWRDFGWIGVIASSLCAGVAATFVYLRARRGHLVTTVLFALTFPAIIGTPIGDGFFGSLVPWLLIIGLVVFLRHGPRIAFRGSVALRSSALWRSATL